MRNALVISYLFPPSGGVGVPRAIAYTRYLPAHGYRVFVLAPSKPSTAYHDPELAKLIPEGTTVVRAWNPEVPFVLKNVLWRSVAKRKQKTQPIQGEQGKDGIASRLRKLAQHAFFPDSQRTWAPFAVRKASAVIRRRKIDTVILIAPPYSLFQIGLALKSKFPHLTLVTDLRDDWLGYYSASGLTPSDYAQGWSSKLREKASRLEREIMRASDLVSIATETWREDLRRRYPHERREKFFCTTNGFEPELFRPADDSKSPSENITITYFGTLNTSTVYSPENYFAALDLLPVEIRQRIISRFIGRVTADCKPMLQREGVEETGFVTKQKGIELLMQADCLLLIATSPASHAGKLFDYLGAGKPILALSPEHGEIAKVLKETGAGIAVDPFDPRRIAAVLTEFLEGRHRLYQPNATAIARYSWPEIVKRFASYVADQGTQNHFHANV